MPLLHSLLYFVFWRVCESTFRSLSFNFFKQILMELKDWEGALTYCKLTIPVYQSMHLTQLLSSVRTCRFIAPAKSLIYNFFLGVSEVFSATLVFIVCPECSSYISFYIIPVPGFYIYSLRLSSL